VHGSTPNFIYIGTMSDYVPLPAARSTGFWGAGGGGVKNSKKGVVSFVHRTATISIFSALPNVVQYVGHRPAHIGVKPSRSAKAILQGGPKSSKTFRIFHHFQTLRPYMSETIKNRGI